MKPLLLPLQESLMDVVEHMVLRNIPLSHEASFIKARPKYNHYANIISGAGSRKL
jgi:hypothetical protein